MKRARHKFVDQFFDLEATVGDRDEEEDESDGDDGTSAQFSTVTVLKVIIRFHSRRSHYRHPR
jgi:hypothetical protein